jgi:ABC-2 type transport system permease protein
LRRIFAIFTATFKHWFRSRSGIFFSILFPVMLLLIFGSVFGSKGTTTYTIHIQNLDVKDGVPTSLSQALINFLNSTNAFDIKEVPSNITAESFVKKESGILAGRLRVLVIPKGFEDGLINGSAKVRLSVVVSTLERFANEYAKQMPKEKAMIEEGIVALKEFASLIKPQNVTLTLLVNKGDVSAQIVRSIVDSVVNTFNYKLIGTEPIARLEEKVVEVRKLSWIDYYIPGLIGAFVMTNGIIGVTTVVTEYRRRGIVKRLASTPLKKAEWIIGNLLTQTSLAFLLTIVMIGIGWLVFEFRAIPDALSLLIIIISAFLFSGIGLTLAGVVKDVEAASALGNAIAFPMMFLSGVFWPIDAMPGYLQVIAKFMPLTYMADGLRASMIYQHVPFALYNLLIIGLLTITFIVIGSIVTRWTEE